jgi:long-chain acyl-CoA synthetase
MPSPPARPPVFQGVKQKVAAASPLAQKLFGFGLAAGSARFERGQIGAGRAWNALVFKKVQALLGGKVRAMITGSAPLAPDVQRFVQTVFNCPVRQGYGLTETCAASVLTHLGDNTPSSVGAPSACACVRLRDWAEGGYLVSDKSKAGVNMPRGEVRARRGAPARGPAAADRAGPARRAPSLHSLPPSPSPPLPSPPLPPLGSDRRPDGDRGLPARPGLARPRGLGQE